MYTLAIVASGELWFKIVYDVTRGMQINYLCYDITSYEEYIKYGNKNILFLIIIKIKNIFKYIIFINI